MLIVTDNGQEAVNTDQTFAFTIVDGPEGAVLMAFGGPVRTALVMGGHDRCDKALEAITRGVRERRHILDMRDEVGKRPRANIVVPQIVRPGNGEGGSRSSRA